MTDRKLTLKEATLKCLEETGNAMKYKEVYEYIRSKKYYDFGIAPTPHFSVSGVLTRFIQTGDARVLRKKEEDGEYSYFLARNANNIVTDSRPVKNNPTIQKTKLTKSYEERDLHILLSTYLKDAGIESKTIFHEQSTGSKDGNQIWMHPDMVGVRFLQLKTKASQNFLKVVNRAEIFKVNSYEIKKEINNDSELKKAYFQAVSNSSWANYGYLVALEFNDALLEEIERLNQAFGIGIIKLHSYPHKSKILFPAKYRELDFKTIDKMCHANKLFEDFIGKIENILNAEEKYLNGAKKELEESCDNILENDEEIELYLTKHNIPIEDKIDN